MKSIDVIQFPMAKIPIHNVVNYAEPKGSIEG